MAYKAFVSSTFEDLWEHRREVIASLRKAGIFVDPMEDWAAATGEPKKFSQERTKGCDLCVLLVGFRRGHIPPGGKLSITQLEYQSAVNSKTDVLVFMLKEDSPWPRKFDELDKDSGIRQWRAELLERRGVGFFGLEPNSVEIAPALTRWLAERQHSSASPEARRERIALLRWLARMPDQFDSHFREIWRLGFGGNRVSAKYEHELETAGRELVTLYTRIVDKLPDAFAETKPSDREQGCFNEVFPAFRREAEACFQASRVLVNGLEADTPSGSRVPIPFSVTYQAVVPEHLRILRMAAENIVILFPVNEVEQARQPGAQQPRTG